MSEESIREKEVTFNRIRQEANNSMYEVIKNCNAMTKMLSLKKSDLKNIIITYNNKIIELEKEFNKAGIDFYDRTQCESRFIIENRLQGIILTGKKYISDYISTLNIPKEQMEQFVDSYKKPSTFNKIFKGQKYQPMKCVLTPEQSKLSAELLQNYLNCCNQLSEFTIEKDIVEAILYYKVLANTLGTTDFDSRINSIDKELQMLGYSSITDIVKVEFENQDLSLKNINNLHSICIKKIN